MELTPTYAGVDPMMAYVLGRDNDEDNFMNNPFFYLIFIWLFAGFGGGGFGGWGGNALAGADLALTRDNGITNDFIFTNLNSDIDSLRNQLTSQGVTLGNGMADLGYALNTQIGEVKYDVATQFGQAKYDNLVNLNALQSQLQSCCCNTQRAIDKVGFDLQHDVDALRYDTAMQTATITNQAGELACGINRNIDSAKYENQAHTTAILHAIAEDGDKTRALITANETQHLRDQLVAAQNALSNAQQTSVLGAQLDAIYNKIPRTPIPAYPVQGGFSYGNTATVIQ